MKILALEFSSPVRSVAVRSGATHGYAEETGRSTQPFTLIDAALSQTGWTCEDIECIAVGLGPGSNAGIRTAIAIAQGWQVARGVRVLGISSADAVAEDAVAVGAEPPLFVGIELRPGDLWVARYEYSNVQRLHLAEPFRAVLPGEKFNQAIFRMDAISDRAVAGEAWTSLPPTADFLALVAAERDQFVRGEELAPVMLRTVEFVKAPLPRMVAE